jgi:glycosyltransferase involved in cell wall biosynthesis
MRIALITTYPPGKGSLNEYAYHFVRALRAKPEVDELYLLVDDLPDGAQYPAGVQADDQLAPLHFVPSWSFDGWGNAGRIVAAVRRLKPDAVLFNLQFATFGGNKGPAALGLIAPLLVKVAGYPTLVLLHNIMETVDLAGAGFVGNRLMEMLVRTFGTLVTRTILGADLVALTIPKYVDILRRKYGTDKVWLAPHGSFEDHHSLPNFDLPDGPRQILTFGKFGTYKKVETLIEAVAQLNRHGSVPLELVIAGTDSPNAQGYLQSVQAAYAQMPHVRFTGYVPEDEVPQLFAQAAAVVFPYTSTTGSSGVLHQAGAYGKAVILPEIGDFVEVICEEGYQGEYFEPDNVESLAAAIRRLVESPDRREAMGRRNFLASCGLPIGEVVDWYLLHLEQLT